MENKRVYLDLVRKIFIFSLGINIFVSAEKFEFHGEIQERTDDKVTVVLTDSVPAMRKFHAEVYSPDRIVYLPGTGKALVNEWKKAGLIELGPSKNSLFSGVVLSEISPLEVQRGTKVRVLPNQPPFVSVFQPPKTQIPPGTKVFIPVSVKDPEGDGIFFTWSSDKGKWLKDKTRTSYNFFVAPPSPGTVHLELVVFDVYGAKTVKNGDLYIEEMPPKDYYKLRQVYFQNNQGIEILDAFQDLKGDIYILEKDKISVYSPQGFLIFEIKNVFTQAVKLQIDRDQYLYVLDSEKKRIVKFNKDGKILKEFKDASEEGDFLKIENPVDFSFDEEGNLYLLDQDLCRIILFSQEGYIIGSIGSKGSGKGKFSSPIAIEMHQDEMYVLDQGDLRVKVFKNRHFLRSFSLSERFLFSDLCIDPVTQTLYVTGNLNAKSSSKIEGYLMTFSLKEDLNSLAEITSSKGLGIHSCNIDLEGNLLLISERKGPVKMIQPNGMFMGDFLFEEPVRSPHICTGPLGSIYFESEKVIKRMNYFGWVDCIYPNDEKILDMCVDQNENLYVLTKGNTKVKKFNIAGQQIQDIKVPLLAKEKIAGMGIDGKNRLFVLKDSLKLLVFSSEGGIESEKDLKLTQFGSTAGIKDVALFHVDHMGRILLTDRLKKNVYLGDLENDSYSVLKQDFGKISGLSVDLFGNIYVLDYTNKAVYKFSDKGSLIRDISLKKEAKRPAQLAAFGDGEILVFDEAEKMMLLYK